MKQIPLTQGLYALVDNNDYPELSKHKWCVSCGTNTCYAKRRCGKDTVLMHRELLGLKKHNERLSDHKNCNGLDNQQHNLRISTVAQNQQNQKPCRVHSSKYKGVSLNKDNNKWYARIQYGGKQIYLGLFDDEKKAAIAYDIKAKKFFGEFAYLNFPAKLVELNKIRLKRKRGRRLTKEGKRTRPDKES